MLDSSLALHYAIRIRWQSGSPSSPPAPTRRVAILSPSSVLLFFQNFRNKLQRRLDRQTDVARRVARPCDFNRAMENRITRLVPGSTRVPSRREAASGLVLPFLLSCDAKSLLPSFVFRCYAPPPTATPSATLVSGIARNSGIKRKPSLSARRLDQAAY